jgi:hypothetical protein
MQEIDFTVLNSSSETDTKDGSDSKFPVTVCINHVLVQPADYNDN